MLSCEFCEMFNKFIEHLRWPLPDQSANISLTFIFCLVAFAKVLSIFIMKLVYFEFFFIFWLDKKSDDLDSFMGL